MNNGTKQRKSRTPATQPPTPDMEATARQSVGFLWTERCDKAGMAMAYFTLGTIAFSLLADTGTPASWLTVIGGVIVLLAFLVRHFVGKFDKSNADYISMLESDRERDRQKIAELSRKLELAQERLRIHGDDSGIIS